MVPVPDDRTVARVAESNRDVGHAGRVRVAQVERAIAEHTDRVLPVVVPVPAHRNVARVAESDGDVGHAGRVGVAQVEHAVPEHARGAHPVAVPVTGQRDVAGGPVVEEAIRDPCRRRVAQVPRGQRGARLDRPAARRRRRVGKAVRGRGLHEKRVGAVRQARIGLRRNDVGDIKLAVFGVHFFHHVAVVD